MDDGNLFINRHANDVILKYPYEGIDLESKEYSDLGVLSWKYDNNIKTSNTLRKEATHTITTITLADYNRLERGLWLNDSIVDLWVQWITREIRGLSTDVHFFSSQFYTKLNGDDSDRLAVVTNWTSHKKIDIFKKKLLIFPIHQKNHWSLVVVVNPGCIEIMLNDDNTEIDWNKKETSFCMFFNSSHKASRSHRKNAIFAVLSDWLNAEYYRLKDGRIRLSDVRTKYKGPFNLDTCQLYNPDGMSIISFPF